MIQIYHNSRCSKSRQCLSLIENSGKKFEIIKYLENPQTIAELTVLISKLGIEPIDLVRKKEKLWIENYKNKFGLTNEQALTLLENYQNDGINGCISTLVYYLKQSAIKQYKELKGKEIGIDDIILPFVLSDKSLREHFEKSTDNTWDKTTAIDNIKKIVTITNDQVFKHHNKYLSLNGPQRKRLINDIKKGHDNVTPFID